MMPEDKIPKRFADEELNEFYREFKEDAHRKEQAAKELLECLNANKEAMDKLRADTSDLVAAWKATEGAVKVGAMAGKFVKWVSGFAIVGWLLVKFGWLLVEFGKYIDKMR